MPELACFFGKFLTYECSIITTLSNVFFLSSLMIVEMRSILARTPYVEGYRGGVCARRYNRPSGLRDRVVATKCSDLAERFDFITEKGSLLRGFETTSFSEFL